MIPRDAQNPAVVQKLESRLLFSTKYTIIDMGLAYQESGSGGNFFAPNAAISSNYVAGQLYPNRDIDDTPRAYEASPAKAKPTDTLLPTLKGYYTATVNAVTSTGVEVGYSYSTNTDDGDIYEATEWKKGKAVKLGSGFATGINSSGEVVGTYLNQYGQPEAAEWLPHSKVLGTLGGPTSQANGINNAGIIVGTADNEEGVAKPFYYENGKMTVIGPNGFEDIDEGTATAINNKNVIVGTLNSEPFAFSNGKLTTLTGTGQLNLGSPMAINDSGVIVGSDNDGACEWYGSKLYDLAKLIPAHSGWLLSEAVGINAQGQIIGFGSYEGDVHEFLLTPKT
jgi:probable HAF family extracellular repeat protein